MTGPFIGRADDWPAVHETISRNKRRKLNRFCRNRAKKMAKSAAATLDNIILSVLMPMRAKEQP